jgi:arsenite-transporting ATPase
MVIKEAQRTYTYLSLYGYLTDLVVCNRVIPEGANDGYFAAMAEAQRRYVETARQAFSPVPMRLVPYFDQEVVGMGMLDRLAMELFGDEDPSQFFHRERPFTIEKVGEDYLMELPVPLVDRADLSLLETPEELVIEIGRFRRNLMLPRVLVGRHVQSAKLNEGKLHITFGGTGNGVRSGTNSRAGNASQRPGA